MVTYALDIVSLYFISPWTLTTEQYHKKAKEAVPSLLAKYVNKHIHTRQFSGLWFIYSLCLPSIRAHALGWASNISKTKRNTAVHWRGDKVTLLNLFSLPMRFLCILKTFVSHYAEQWRHDVLGHYFQYRYRMPWEWEWFFVCMDIDGDHSKVYYCFKREVTEDFVTGKIQFMDYTFIMVPANNDCRKTCTTKSDWMIQNQILL